MGRISDGNSLLSMDALESAVRGADACAVVVPAWLLRKIVAYDRGPGAAVFSLPRVESHAIERARLLAIAQREELPLGFTPPAGPVVVLLGRPETEVLSSTPGAEVLRRYWRLLFRVRVRSAVQAAVAGAASPRVAVQERIERLGRAGFNEARFVLQRERCLTAWADDLETYAEFAAQYLDFHFFAPAALRWYFPAIDDGGTALRVLGEDVDGAALLKATRLAGAAEPEEGPGAAEEESGGTGKPRRRVRRDGAHREKLLAEAERADGVGNDVRAAIYRMRVYRASFLPGSSRDNLSAVYAEALRDLDQLAARLKGALRLDDSMARQWRAWLVALLENAASGWWNAEGRLLYDLQKACAYQEREIYSVNVMEYLLDFARRPLRRPQPGQRLVLTLKSLRSALRRAGRARLSPYGRAELVRLLGAAVEEVEGRLRQFLRPGVTSALDEGGLHPSTATETAARAKLTEELLDEIADNGYLTFSAVRDAVSRNEMKLDDLGGGAAARGETARGDQLLRIDRKLEHRLDFVYRRGEIYLRGFHRLSSWFFATRSGRLLTKWVILPFGGSFLVLEALDHSLGLLIQKIANKQHIVAAAAASAGQAFGPTPAVSGHPAESHKLFNQWWLLLLLGVFLLGLVNVPAFRSMVSRGLRRVFRGLRVVLVDGPRWVATRPAVQAIFASRFVRLTGRYVVKPLLCAGLAYGLLPDAVSERGHALTLAGVFLVMNILLNSRAGRALEQAVLHGLRTTFARLTWEVFAAVARRIVQVFQGVLEAVDRLLYAVDELLRFRAGQRRFTVASKAVLGVFWFYIAYVTRFVINLLVEPQINPIKHFPVVTVSHKMILPTAPYIARALQSVSIESSRAWTAAGLITLCTPGIFGFLAWEFKENWKLYKANRSRVLKAVRAGSHGETLATFLRPGFHSGTVPKIFHRLRKAQVRAGAALPATNKHLEAAHHVEGALVAFFEREFIALLNRHPLFADAPIRLGHVHLAATLIRVEFLRAGEPLVLSFEQRALWILAGVDQAGWAGELTGAQVRQFSGALVGLYKHSGVDLVREQVESLFGAGARFELRRNELVVWPGGDFAVEAAYDLSAEGAIAPRFVSGAGEGRLPVLAREQILFGRIAVLRDAWNGLWEVGGAAGVGLPEVRVLPVAAGVNVVEAAGPLPVVASR